MDSKKFDALARAMAQGGSRRWFLGTVLGGVSLSRAFVRHKGLAMQNVVSSATPIASSSPDKGQEGLLLQLKPLLGSQRRKAIKTAQQSKAYASLATYLTDKEQLKKQDSDDAYVVIDNGYELRMVVVSPVQSSDKTNDARAAAAFAVGVDGKTGAAALVVRGGTPRDLLLIGKHGVEKTPWAKVAAESDAGALRVLSAVTDTRTKCDICENSCSVSADLASIAADPLEYIGDALFCFKVVETLCTAAQDYFGCAKQIYRDCTDVSSWFSAKGLISKAGCFEFCSSQGYGSCKPCDGRICSSDRFLSEETCECECIHNGSLECDGRCVSAKELKTSNDNCGRCGNQCKSGQTCIDGSCHAPANGSCAGSCITQMKRTSGGNVCSGMGAHAEVCCRSDADCSGGGVCVTSITYLESGVVQQMADVCSGNGTPAPGMCWFTTPCS
jgi:hypothetical protein